MQKDLTIIYWYENKAAKARVQRTFKLSEIKRGEDDAHLLLIPGFEFVGMEVVIDRTRGDV